VPDVPSGTFGAPTCLRSGVLQRGEGMIWTAYYWIGLDARDPRRLFLNETDSTFTKTEPDPSERNERPQ
jgi:hypothetical protein